MKDLTLTVGDKGFLAYLNAYNIEAEFVGYGNYEPEWPADHSRFYRALQSCKGKYSDVHTGDILEENGEYLNEFFLTREAAQEAIRKEAAYWLQSKRDELAKLEQRANS